MGPPAAWQGCLRPCAGAGSWLRRRRRCPLPQCTCAARQRRRRAPAAGAGQPAWPLGSATALPPPDALPRRQMRGLPATATAPRQASSRMAGIDAVFCLPGADTSPRSQSRGPGRPRERRRCQSRALPRRRGPRVGPPPEPVSVPRHSPVSVHAAHGYWSRGLVLGACPWSLVRVRALHKPAGPGPQESACWRPRSARVTPGRKLDQRVALRGHLHMCGSTFVMCTAVWGP